MSASTPSNHESVRLFYTQGVPLESYRGWAIIREYGHTTEQMRYRAQRSTEEIVSYNENYLLLAIDFLMSKETTA